MKGEHTGGASDLGNKEATAWPVCTPAGSHDTLQLNDVIKKREKKQHHSETDSSTWTRNVN